MKIVIPREELEYKYNILKMSVERIAKAYGYNEKTVSKNLKEYGIITGYNRTPTDIAPLEEIKHEYFVLERTVAQIAIAHQCTARTIYQRFHDAGIKVEFRYPAEVVIPIAKLEHMYCVLGMTTGEIGKEYGCSSGAILRKIKKNGLYGKRNVEAGTKVVAWNKGLTKETNDIIANYAKKLIGKPIWNQGLTKDTHPSLLALSNKFKGRNKDNHEGVARQAKVRLGRTKETCEYMARAAEKRRGLIPWNKGKKCPELSHVCWNKGRTMGTDEILRSNSDKMKGHESWNKGQNKYMNPSIAQQSSKMAGRTKETHRGVAIVAEKLRQYCGEKANRWCGGLSFEPYTSEFNKVLKEKIRKRDGYVCQDCGKVFKEGDRRLSVHHIDYNKKHSVDGNLISLCNRCHVKTNSNREYWEAYYKIKVIFCMEKSEVSIC